MSYLVATSLVILAVHVAFIVSTFVRAPSESRFARLATDLGLPVPTDLADSLIWKSAARHRAIAIGGCVGLGLCLGALAVFHGLSYDQSALVLLACTALGWTLALCVSALRAVGAPRGIRVARAVSVGLNDYLSPLARLLVGIAVAVAIVVIAVAGRFGRAGVFAWVCVAVALIMFAIAELASRRILAQRQPADSDIELAWNDAVRAQVLRDLYSAPVAFAAVAVLLVVWAIVGTATGLTILPVVSLVFLFGSWIMRAVARRTHLRQYVLRRLWPTQVRTGWRG